MQLQLSVSVFLSWFLLSNCSRKILYHIKHARRKAMYGDFCLYYE